MASSISLLLVEDDAIIRAGLEDDLSDAGFALTLAASGTEALAALDAGAWRFRGLVTDIRLGAGPDGWEVARHARHLVPEIPVVYVSGDSGADWTEKGVPHSIFVPKPFVGAQVITAVSTLLNEADPPWRSTQPGEPS